MYQSTALQKKKQKKKRNNNFNTEVKPTRFSGQNTRQTWDDAVDLIPVQLE